MPGHEKKTVIADQRYAAVGIVRLVVYVERANSDPGRFVRVWVNVGLRVWVLAGQLLGQPGLHFFVDCVCVFLIFWVQIFALFVRVRYFFLVVVIFGLVCGFVPDLVLDLVRSGSFLGVGFLYP